MGENFISAIEPRMRFNQIVAKREFKAPQGIPDFLLFRRCDSTLVYVVALELKLKDWRKGIYQAFKYRSFCNAAYVIVDRYYQDDALANIQIFVDSNIGLATFSLEGELEVLSEPVADIPFSAYYSSVLNSTFKKEEPGLEKCSRFHRSKMGAVSLTKLDPMHW